MVGRSIDVINPEKKFKKNQKKNFKKLFFFGQSVGQSIYVVNPKTLLLQLLLLSSSSSSSSLSLLLLLLLLLSQYHLINKFPSESKNPSQLLTSSLMSFCSRNCLKQQKHTLLIHSREIGYFAEAKTRVCITFTCIRKCYVILHLMVYPHRGDAFFDTRFVCRLS